MKLYPFSVVKHSKDFYSAIIRLCLGLCIALYVWLGMSSSDFIISQSTYFNFAAIFFSATFIMGLDIFRNPECATRRYITLFFDFSCTTYASMLTGGGGSEFILIYIWLYIAYGTRYGAPYLFTAVILVLLEYNYVLIIDNAWSEYPLTSSAQIFVLITMPLYLYSMIRQLRQARQEAEHATRAKSNFLATMSHEIRTPMSGIIGTVHLLQKTDQNKEQKEYTSALLDASKSLHALIDDILDFSKIEANKLELQNTRFDLHHMVKEVVSVLSPNAEDHDLELIVHIDPELPALVVGDSQRIRQILFNLLGNAIKFTEQGEVSLQVTREEQAKDKPGQNIQLRFDIIDTGIGISAEQQKKIFDSFTQAEDLQTHKFGGTGLGTTISKQLVEFMGGQIGVESEPGKGSHFWFSLSLPIEQQSNSRDEYHPNLSNKHIAAVASKTALTILIAEDEDINAMVLASFLKNSGHKIKRVLNGALAVNELSENHYDLAFMDMRMPEMNGLEATRTWREMEQNDQHIPIIALTANATMDDRKACLEAGMDDFITKPISPEQLNTTIHKFYIQA